MAINYKRRAWFIAATQGVLAGSLLARMVYLQGFKSNQLYRSAEGNRINYQIIFPRRGLIVDRNNFALAINNQNLQVKIITKECKDIDKLLNVVQQTINLSQAKINSIIEDFNKKKDEILIAQYLDWSEFSKLNLNIVEVAGLDASAKHSRYYPVYAETAHVVGYVAKASKQDFKSGDSLLLHPDAIVGKNGVEKIFEKQLTGFAGRTAYEINAKGRRIRLLRDDPDRPGSTVKLSINYALQNYIFKLFDNYRRASSIVIDITTGEVLSIVSKPSYNSNHFIQGIGNEEWNKLLNLEDKPLINRSISGQYPPGSTFKIVTLLAGLVEGIAQDFEIDCKGFFRLGNKTFYDWVKYGHGKVDYKAAFITSCDIYFYQLALKLGLEKINRVAKELGLGELTNIELTGEKKGLLPTEAWKRKTYNQRWNLGETAIVGIGQGFVLATPLQLAVMAARVASSKKVIPTIKFVDEKVTFQDLDISEEYLSIIRELMFGVVNSDKGTARGSRIWNKSFDLAGKTGTSQVYSMAAGERYGEGNDDLEWRLRDHSLFVGFAPADKPRWASSVIVEHAGHGSSHAAPVTSKLMQYLFSIDKLNNAI